MTPQQLRAALEALGWSQGELSRLLAAGARMTPQQFRQALSILGWSHRELARRLACSTNLPNRWARGTAAIPDAVAYWLAAVSAAVAAHPAPEWRKVGARGG